MAGPTRGPESSEAALAPREQPTAAKAGGAARLQALVKRVLANGAAAGTEAPLASCRPTQQQAGAVQAALQQAEGSLSFPAAPVPTPPAESEPLHAGTAAAAAAAAALGSPSTARPAAAVAIKTEDDPGATGRPGQWAAAQAGGSQQALPVGSSQASGRGRWPVGVSQDRWGACLVRLKAPLDDQGRPTAGAARQEVVARRVLSGLGAAAVARDLALMWRQLALGQPLAQARETYNHALPSLEKHQPLLSGRQACATLADLRSLLERLDSSGQLQSMAAALAPSATDPQAAAAVSAGATATLPAARRGTKRPRGQVAGGAATAAAEPETGRKVSRSRGTPGGRQRQRQAGGGGGGGGAWGPPEAVGRRLRAWLVLDDCVRREHHGRVLEVTPSGMHHVLFDDEEEALLDLGRADFEFTSPPDLAAAAAAAAAGGAPAEAAADMGQRLRVWWPQEGRAEGAWYGCSITHVLRNGMHCVRYDSDGSELLLDVLDPDTRLQWDCLQRQRRHDAARRGARRQAQGRQQRPEGQQRGQEQTEGRSGSGAAGEQRQQRQQPVAAAELPSPDPPAKPAEGAPAEDVFLELMDAASQPAAAAAGLTEELLGAYAALFDTLPPGDRARNEQRIRFLLARQQHSGAAALMRAAVELRLGRLRPA